MNLIIECNESTGVRRLGEAGPELAAFLSFAAMRGFGATHPLIALADRLHDHNRISMGPFSTFYEAEAEDSEDEERLELAWQPAGPLLEALRQTVGAIDLDPTAAALVTRSGLPDLRGSMARAIALLASLDPGAPVRLTYTL